MYRTGGASRQREKKVTGVRHSSKPWVKVSCEAPVNYHVVQWAGAACRSGSGMPSGEKEISNLTLRIINCQYERQHRSVLWLAMVRRPKPYLITKGVFIPSECFFQYAPEYSVTPPVR